MPGSGVWREVFNSDVYESWVNQNVTGNGGAVLGDGHHARIRAVGVAGFARPPDPRLRSLRISLSTGEGVRLKFRGNEFSLFREGRKAVIAP